MLQTLTRTLSPNKRPLAPIDEPPSPSPLAELSAYLSELARDADVRAASAWKAFFDVGREDLESIRVERRVRRVRSDLAAHVTTAPLVPNVEDSILMDAVKAEQQLAGGSGTNSSTEEDERLPVPMARVTNGSRSSRRSTREKLKVEDFDIMRVLGKGCAGKVGQH